MMRSLIMEQVGVLRSVVDSVEGIIDVIEEYNVDETTTAFELNGRARDKVMYAIGYIVGVAEERNCTVRELLDQEDIR